MRGLVPRIHVLRAAAKTWMAPNSGPARVLHYWNPQVGKPDLHPNSGLPEFGITERRKLGKPDLR